MAGGENHETKGTEMEWWMKKLEEDLKEERERGRRERKEMQKFLQNMMGRMETLEEKSGEQNLEQFGRWRQEIAVGKRAVGENGELIGMSIGLRSTVVIDAASSETPKAGRNDRWGNVGMSNGPYHRNYDPDGGDDSGQRKMRCYGQGRESMGIGEDESEVDIPKG